jgi:hypothetical protein
MEVMEERGYEVIQYNLLENTTAEEVGARRGKVLPGRVDSRTTMTMGEDVSRATSAGSGAARTIAIVRSMEAWSRAFRRVIGRKYDAMSRTICRPPNTPA